MPNGEKKSKILQWLNGCVKQMCVDRWDIVESTTKGDDNGLDQICNNRSIV
jgi:hypothetical protein